MNRLPRRYVLFRDPYACGKSLITCSIRYFGTHVYIATVLLFLACRISPLNGGKRHQNLWRRSRWIEFIVLTACG